MAAMVPADVLHEVARHQMGEKVTVDFPDAWRTNLIEVREEKRELVRSPRWELEPKELGLRRGFRVDDALADIHRHCEARGIPEQQWLAELSQLAADDVSGIIIETCIAHGVSPDDLLAEAGQFQFEY